MRCESLFEDIKEIFKKTKTKLYYIELDDEQLNKEMSHIIIHMEKEITQFRKVIDETTMEVKDEELIHLYEEMIQIKSDIDTIGKDINKIVGMKLQNLKYFIINDDSYLADKKKDIVNIRTEIDSFLQIIEQRPSHNALKKGLIVELLKQLKRIEKLIEKIVTDDINLQTIYKKISTA